MERASRRKRAELSKGHVLAVVSFEVLSNLPDDEILLANVQTPSPLLDVSSSKMFHDRQQERLAIYRWRPICDRPVQSQETYE